MVTVVNASAALRVMVPELVSVVMTFELLRVAVPALVR